jgi:hypothetical protein
MSFERHPLLLTHTSSNYPCPCALQLTFRTFNRDFDHPNHNDDHLACLLRDALMPERGRLHRERSPKLLKRTNLFQMPYLGIPGIVNFVDVRTQWFDGAVKRAIADGFKQVVILAAGYDTRAYRLAAKGVRFYEVDLPHASETKQRLVVELLPRSKVGANCFQAPSVLAVCHELVAHVKGLQCSCCPVCALAELHHQLATKHLLPQVQCTHWQC